MPIKGLSEVRRLPRLGKIRLGIKSVSQKTKKEYPKAVDYFVCPPEVQALYGEQPRELDIVFPLEADVGEWQWYKAYSASRGLICKGDGETGMALLDTSTGKFATRDSQDTEMTEVVCDPEKCELYQKGQCHRVMSLQFIVRGIKALGVYQLNTGSTNSIKNVNSTLSLVKGLAGRYSLIPMKLQVIPQEVQAEGKKKTVYVLQLVVEKTFDDLLVLPELPTSRALLPSSDNEAPDDLYPEGLIENDPDVTPPQASARPGPARKAKSKPRAAAKDSAETAASDPTSVAATNENDVDQETGEIQEGSETIPDDMKAVPYSAEASAAADLENEPVTQDQEQDIAWWIQAEKFPAGAILKQQGKAIPAAVSKANQAQYELLKEARNRYVKALAKQNGWELDEGLALDEKQRAWIKAHKDEVEQIALNA